MENNYILDDDEDCNVDILTQELIGVDKKEDTKLINNTVHDSKDKKEIIYCGVTLTNENVASSFKTSSCPNFETLIKRKFESDNSEIKVAVATRATKLGKIGVRNWVPKSGV